MNNEETFRILSLDGGGTRGIYSAQILAKMEKSFDTQIKDCFNLIAGTSTGSIIAGAAAIGIPMKKIVQLFEAEGPRIFRKKWYRHPWIRSKYLEKSLHKVLDKYFSSVTLGGISKPLMIMSTNLSTGEVYVFKSEYLKQLGLPYCRDPHVLLRDAILASCAAPTFFDPVKVDDTLLTDGGLWANNPSIVSLTEAISKFKKNIDQIRMLSIGTGSSKNIYTQKRNWGFLTGWERKKIILYILAMQSQASKNMVQLLLKENYLRVDPLIENSELDDIKHLGHLKASADADFVKDADKIKSFIGIGDKSP